MRNSNAAAIFLADDAHTVDGTPDGPVIVGQHDGLPINGAQCSNGESGTTHYHAHLTIVVNGRIVTVPAGTGIYQPVAVDFHDGQPSYFVVANTSGGCYYDTHVHAADGVVHVESPQAHNRVALGYFLDIWGRYLTPAGFGPYAGPTRWFDTDETVGGPGMHPVTELTGTDPHLTPMLDHHEYTIEVNGALDIRNFTFSSAAFATYGYP